MRDNSTPSCVEVVGVISFAWCAARGRVLRSVFGRRSYRRRYVRARFCKRRDIIASIGVRLGLIGVISFVGGYVIFLWFRVCDGDFVLRMCFMCVLYRFSNDVFMFGEKLQVIQCVDVIFLNNWAVMNFENYIVFTNTLHLSYKNTNDIFHFFQRRTSHYFPWH